jgi:hypothetical protein
MQHHYKETRAFREIQERWGSALTFHDLIIMAEELAKRLPGQPRISRDAKRRKEILFEWLEEHFDDIKPLLQNVHFLDNNSKAVAAAAAGD